MESVFTPPVGVRVSLSSGESFYIDGSIAQAAAALDRGRGRFVAVGGRWVNPHQVCQLTSENVPSLETPETLEAA
jgi:hypothetical protein